MLRLHHIGLVVKDMEKGARHYESAFGMTRVSEVTFDPLQKVNVLFMAQTGTGMFYELLEPVGDDSPAAEWLRRGISLYHICYEVSDIEFTIEDLRKKGCLLISKPSAAAAFGNRRIAFLYTSEKLIIELLEKEGSK